MTTKSDRAAQLAKGITLLAGKAARTVKNSSPEAKAAGAGAVASGTGIAATGLGAHIGIAALGGAVSGVVVLPALAAAIGGIGGYALYKRHKEKRLIAAATKSEGSE